MNDYLRVARLYLIVLVIFTVGRLAVGARGVPYERGHHIFSLVTMTLLASCFYGAFCRKWRGYGVTQAMGVGATVGLMAQAVILVVTVVSYAFHLDTYFVNPRALNATETVPFATAVVGRTFGLIVNTIMSAIAGAVGWALGVTLPDPGEA
jgi:hypothetical protein